MHSHFWRRTAPAHSRLTDVDTLIVDPSVPLHLLLPNSTLYSTLSPAPFIIGTQDYLGFNNGIITYRVSHRTVTFLSRVLAIEYHIIEPDSSIPPQPILDDSPPFDQRATGLALKNYRDAAEGFYLIPQEWFSGYDDPVHGPPAEDLPEGGVRMGIHFAGPVGKAKKWEECVALEEAVWSEAADAARELSVGGTGIELLPGVERVKKAGEDWWRDARNGIDGLVFNEW